MRTYAKRINRASVGALFSLILNLSAQQAAPTAPTPTVTASPQGVAQVANQAVQQSGTGTTPDSSTSAALDYLFNHKPQQGSAAKEAMDANQQVKTDALAQNALGNRQIEDSEMRARFETYLAMNEVPQDQLKAYADAMTNVIDLLHQKKTPEAWQQPSITGWLPNAKLLAEWQEIHTP